MVTEFEKKNVERGGPVYFKMPCRHLLVGNEEYQVKLQDVRCLFKTRTVCHPNRSKKFDSLIQIYLTSNGKLFFCG